jgi:hypothetical protein
MAVVCVQNSERGTGMVFELGAHPFLTLTLCIALFECDYSEPPGFQLRYAVRLNHWSPPYPHIAT